MSCGNYLTDIYFDIRIAKYPSLKMNVQSMNLPGMSAAAPKQPSPLSKLTRGYDQIDFETLTVSSLIDEKMSNYFQIFEWMVGIGFPTNTEERRRLVSTDPRFQSDITVFIMNSMKKPVMEFIFNNCIPVAIGSLQLNAAQADINYPTFDVTFEYDTYRMRSPNS